MKLESFASKPKSYSEIAQLISTMDSIHKYCMYAKTFIRYYIAIPLINYHLSRGRVGRVYDRLRSQRSRVQFHWLDS